MLVTINAVARNRRRRHWQAGGSVIGRRSRSPGLLARSTSFDTYDIKPNDCGLVVGFGGSAHTEPAPIIDTPDLPDVAVWVPALGLATRAAGFERALARGDDDTWSGVRPGNGDLAVVALCELPARLRLVHALFDGEPLEFEALLSPCFAWATPNQTEGE